MVPVYTLIFCSPTIVVHLLILTISKMRTLMSFMVLRCTVILALFLPWCSGDLISATCDQTPNDLLCISTLKRDPRSRKADVAGLSLIMIDAVKAKASSTLEQINKVEKSNSLLKNALMECSENYNVILKSDIPKAIRSLKRSPKLAENAMASSAIEAQGCENSFRSSKKSSPLTDMNKSVYELSNIARSIIRVIMNRNLLTVSRP